MKQVRIEEVTVGSAKNYEFTKERWIESDLSYGDTIVIDNELWIVVDEECDHWNREILDVGCGERITVCHDCGKEL